MVAVHDALPGRHGTAAQVSAVFQESGQRFTMRAWRLRQQHGGIMQWRMGVRRHREHHRHGGTWNMYIMKYKLKIIEL